MLLEYYEKDDRMKTTQVPQWRDLRFVPCPHKETIVRIAALINPSRYITVSKEGSVGMWSLSLKLLRTVHVQTDPDEVKQRDLWVTDFTPMHNIYKLAIALTSKEIAIYDLSSKAEFLCQYRVQGLESTPLCLSYWSNPNNPSESKLVFGDVSGQVNAILFSAATITLFDRPAQTSGSNVKQEICLNVNLADLARGQFKNARFVKHCGHSEWTRQVMYTQYLDCFISCSTNYKSSVVLGWIEKSKINMRTTHFKIPQGVNAFDYNDKANLIATAGVNHHVCLWNPYVISKPVGVLRGHMQSVIAVKFIQSRGQLISLSKDKVLRIWDTHLQVCLQRLSGMFPKGPEVTINIYFDEERTKLLTTFNHQLTAMVMKAEVKDRVMSHEQPVTAAIYNSKFNQVVSVCVASVITMWMVDTGQKVKQFANAHGNAEITAITQDASEMRLFTGSSDGTVKIWDFNGHCHHILVCSEGNPADISQILTLKRTIIVIGWARNLCVYRDSQFNTFYVYPSDWKGRQEHGDDILSMSFCGPHTLVTGSYDGDIVVWNTNSEQSSRHLNQKDLKEKQNPQDKAERRANHAVASPALSQAFTTQAAEDGMLSPQIPETPASASSTRSRRMTRIMSGKSMSDGQDEAVDAITKLIFIENRPGSAGNAAANLISCGSNGWVRFWNSATGQCMGEFVAHLLASSLTMAVDASNHYLVTADADGLVKVWDISEYCMSVMTQLAEQDPPLMLKQFQAHTDSINSLVTFIRNERLLILTASSDCSVALHDIRGRCIGSFGQEEHWKIEPLSEEEIEQDREMEVDEEELSLEEPAEVLQVDPDESWTGEVQAPMDQEGFNPEFRVNTWHHTILGKSYQETRSEKRERRQPQLLKDPPYLTWERTGQPPAGPYKSLDTAELNNVDSIEKPDFVVHPDRYFGERRESKEKHLPTLPVLPPITDNLQKRYDEKNLFPKELLEREAKLRAVREMTSRTSRATGRQSHVKLNVPDSISSRVTSSDSQRRATGSWSKQLMRRNGPKGLGVMQEEES